MEPFERGNQAARRHGFYVELLSPAEDAEVQMIAQAVRELSPVDAEALEPLIQGLAEKLWRRKRAHADLIANGVVRRNGKAAPILRDLETLENSIRRDLKALALTPQSAAELGLTLRNMLTDAGALGLSLVVIRLAARPARGELTFGLKRTEILSAQANGATLLVLAGLIVYEGIHRLISPPQPEGTVILIVALVGILVKGHESFLSTSIGLGCWAVWAVRA